MGIITDAMELDISDIARLKSLIKGLEEEKRIGGGGLCIPIRAISHLKKNGKLDWQDEWELADDWDGVRQRTKKLTKHNSRLKKSSKPIK